MAQILGAAGRAQGWQTAETARTRGARGGGRLGGQAGAWVRMACSYRPYRQIVDQSHLGQPPGV